MSVVCINVGLYNVGSGRERHAKQVLSTGAKVGAAAIGGPLGALAGGAVDIAGTEVLERVLGRQERLRIEGLVQVAKERLDARLARGERPRDDDFFIAPPELARKFAAPWGAPRPAAEEVFEAVLLCAGRTYEERKLPHIAELLVGLAFDPSVTPAHAHHLVRIADRLSYRQLVLVRVFHGDTREEGLAEGDVRPDSPTAIGMEMEDLARAGLLGPNEPGADAYPTHSILEVGLSFIKTTYDGRKLCELMGLERISADDVAALVEELSNLAR